MLTLGQSTRLKSVLDNGFIVPGWLQPRFDQTRIYKKLTAEELRDSLTAITAQGDAREDEERKSRERRLKDKELGTSTLIAFTSKTSAGIKMFSTSRQLYGPQVLTDVTLKVVLSPTLLMFSVYVSGEKPLTWDEARSGTKLFTKTAEAAVLKGELVGGKSSDVVPYRGLYEIIDMDSFFITVVEETGTDISQDWGATIILREIGGVPIRDYVEDGNFEYEERENREAEREVEEEIEAELEDKGCGPGVEPIAPGRWLGKVWLPPTCAIQVR